MRKRAILAFIVLAAVLLSGCGFRRKKYENPIATDSAQPDKTLFDRAIYDLEKSRYEVARLTLQTLINTYPDSEYLAKAKLAIADSWYRQGGSSALAQAEAEYKDFITFFPTMEESVEAQLKVAMIHYQQMEKPDRDRTHAIRAEQELKQLLIQFPNSKFSEEAMQRLREVQEVLAEGEFRIGRFYFIKGSNRAAVARLKDLADHYPYYSQADTALWMLAKTYERSGKEFQDPAALAYSRIASDYPLSDHLDEAKQRLGQWKKPIPEAKPEAIARMKFEQEHRETTGMVRRSMGIFSKRPDVSMAAKTGDPMLVNIPGPPPPPEPVATSTTGAPASTIVLQPVEGAAPNTPPVSSSGPTPAPSKPEAGAPASAAPAAAPTTQEAAPTDQAKPAKEKEAEEAAPAKKKGLLRRVLRLPAKENDKKKKP